MLEAGVLMLASVRLLLASALHSIERNKGRKMHRPTADSIEAETPLAEQRVLQQRLDTFVLFRLSVSALHDITVFLIFVVRMFQSDSSSLRPQVLYAAFGENCFFLLNFSSKSVTPKRLTEEQRGRTGKQPCVNDEADNG